MYRLQVFYNNNWKWGIRDYHTLEAANERMKALAKVGIKSRIKFTSELFE